MIKVFFARVLEMAVNQLLSLDQSHHQILQRHDGKVVQLEILEFQQSLYLVLRKEKIYIYTVYGAVPDTVIRGNLITLLKQIVPSPQLQGLEIEGDMDLAHDVQHLFQNIDINWEEYFSFLVGDFASHRLNKVVQRFKESTVFNTKRSIDDLMEYIQEEKRFVPTREEIEDFYDEVAEVRNDIERLEARWNRIKDK